MHKTPVFRSKEAFLVIGVERYTDTGIPAIRQAWDEFSRRSQEIKNVTGPEIYGIEDYSRDFDMNEGGFPKYYYIAAKEVISLEDIPSGMTGKEIPAGDYAVFNFLGPIDTLHDFFDHIYGEWLPESGFSLDPKLSLDFECYSEQVMDMQNVKLDIWVPVVKE